jgi:Neutral/alkaline non-lysosomal ceramidase, N-terminal
MTSSSARRRFFILALFTGTVLGAADYKAGIAVQVITPTQPIYMSGYANRTHASEGVVHDLKAKALAIEDKSGGRVVIVTTDLIGLPRSISDIVAARVQKEYGLDRARLILNSSHTHTGPLIANNLELLFELKPDERKAVDDYSRKLTDELVMLIGKALQNMEPAGLWFGIGQAHFGINRRAAGSKPVRTGAAAPVDPDVPVLKVTSPDGKVRILLFGYACHNTTFGGDMYKISGDYAGYAQIAIEEAQPGVTAMFMMLCGADQNPNPRGKTEFAEQHGKTLAAEITRVAGENMSRVQGKMRAAYQIVEPGFNAYSRETLEKDAHATGVWRARYARTMLKLMDEGRQIRRYPYPVQAVQFGRDLTIVAMGGEVVVDYGLWVKQNYGAKGMIVAGYSNDVMSYIPTVRILKEGGYEPVTSMDYYGLPGPYNEQIEEQIHGTLRQVLKRVGRKPVKP